jgi:fructose-1,6-bisphosphatase/inositol monophosphatase family enzyme
VTGLELCSMDSDCLELCPVDSGSLQLVVMPNSKDWFVE